MQLGWTSYLGNLLHVGDHFIVSLSLLTEPRQESLAVRGDTLAS
jgi:hypothetical protein